MRRVLSVVLALVGAFFFVASAATTVVHADQPNPTVTCAPSDPAVGTSVGITGTGFQSGKGYSFDAVYPDGTTVTIGGQRADSLGDLSFSTTATQLGTTTVNVRNMAGAKVVASCSFTAT